MRGIFFRDPIASIVESFLEREGASLYNIGRSNRRRSSGREAKLLYAERVSRGYQIYGVSSNSKRKDFLPTWVLFPFLVLFECLSRLRPLEAV